MTATTPTTLALRPVAILIPEGVTAIRLTVPARPDSDASPFGGVRFEPSQDASPLRSTVFGIADAHGVNAMPV